MADDQELAESPAGVVFDGAYQITRVISRGSMGVVYEAVQLRLNRRVALKVIAPWPGVC
jgi:eukaryotic-like serine/threonine-protein kinase